MAVGDPTFHVDGKKTVLSADDVWRENKQTSGSFLRLGVI
jgi:hypothetical protein